MALSKRAQRGLRTRQRLAAPRPPRAAATSAPPSLPAAGETAPRAFPGPAVPRFHFWDREDRKRRGTPRDSAPLTQMAESTGRNRSVPPGQPPRPPSPLARPTKRPCAAPAVGPGIWRRDGGGNGRQIFKTEPREQSSPLCTGQAARAAGGRAEGPRAHARAGDPALCSAAAGLA